MKTRILGLVFLGLTSLMSAQNDFAMVTPEYSHSVTSEKPVLKNGQYLSEMTLQSEAVRVTTLQSIAANYDISALSIYNAKTSQTYSVVFKSAENYIKAIYDHDGTITKCEEFYENVRMPYELSSDLAKEYPGWEFHKIHYTIDYAVNETPIFVFEVILKKGKTTKNVQITL
ncbi:hypothetical protein ES711_15440 [Gelidibacter salicanalis]|uniref:Nicotinate-nucleotide adenylyltransferase n=1 Tax=Gelidibacter salicanalis TaxID=291193 RepID=A0A5C7AA91_9FLAO|nr:hypothetical protein [Gelidibacter salicanalis]TXE05690.1 hypothetical protein ES711_15440 [Gelidibacter salicanalis]